MKISNRTKRECLEWAKAVLAAFAFWFFVCIGLAASTIVHDWHMAEREVLVSEK